jgi:hypothetical protein
MRRQQISALFSEGPDVLDAAQQAPYTMRRCALQKTAAKLGMGSYSTLIATAHQLEVLHR